MHLHEADFYGNYSNYNHEHFSVRSADRKTHFTVLYDS